VTKRKAYVLVSALTVVGTAVALGRWWSGRAPTTGGPTARPTEPSTSHPTDLRVSRVVEAMARANAAQETQEHLQPPLVLEALAPDVRRVFAAAAPASDAFFTVFRDEACRCRTRGCAIQLDERYARKVDAVVLGDRERLTALLGEAAGCINAAWLSEEEPFTEDQRRAEWEGARSGLAANEMYGHKIEPAEPATLAPLHPGD